ncbi:hypothetical protein STEG23_026442, partial [Scotinomys teguina]
EKLWIFQTNITSRLINGFINLFNHKDLESETEHAIKNILNKAYKFLLGGSNRCALCISPVVSE